MREDEYSEQQDEQEQDEAFWREQEAFERGRKVKLFASTFTPALFVDLLSQGVSEHGVIGAALCGLGAYVVAQHGEAVVEMFKSMTPPSVHPHHMRAHQQQGRRTLMQRLWGIYPDPLPHDEQDHAQAEEQGSDQEEPSPDPGTGEGEPQAAPQSPRLPSAPAFCRMAHLITGPDRLVLCWTVDGPLYGSIEDLLSMVIVGKPGRGKTTALIYYVAMLLKAKAVVHVWDPHGSLSDLSGALARLHYTDDLTDLPTSITVLRAELERRRLLYKAIKDRIRDVCPPLLLLVDELPVIGELNRSMAKKGVPEEQTPVKLISDFVLQARKWNCYFIGAGQSTDAEILPTRVTENLSSRIVFYSSNRRASMAGIDLDTAKTFLPLLKPDEVKGRMLFDCSRMSEPILGAIPFLTAADLSAFLGPLMQTPRAQQAQQDTTASISTSGQQGNAEMGRNTTGNDAEMASEAERVGKQQASFPVSATSAEMIRASVQAPVSPEKLEMIRRMKEKHFQDGEIANLVGLAGRKYHLYRQCLEQLGYVQTKGGQQ